MGIVNFGIPQKEAKWLMKKLGLTIFVEGGTYKGGTAIWASNEFEKVFTIENSDAMFEEANKNLQGIGNVSLLKGDSREHLRTILRETDNAFIWLDAHWSGGKTYGEEDECPLIDELEIIFAQSKNFLILIDDARLFMSPPPAPHDFQHWPSLKEVVNILPCNYDIIIFDDVIYIFGSDKASEIQTFFQDLATSQLAQSRQENSNSPLTLFNRIVKLFLKEKKS